MGLGVHAGAGRGQVLVPSRQGPRGDNVFAFWHLLQEARLCPSLHGPPAPTHMYNAHMPAHACEHAANPPAHLHLARTHVRHPVTRVLTHVQLCTRQLRACFLKCLVTPWRWAASLRVWLPPAPPPLPGSLSGPSQWVVSTPSPCLPQLGPGTGGPVPQGESGGLLRVALGLDQQLEPRGGGRPEPGVGGFLGGRGRSLPPALAPWACRHEARAPAPPMPEEAAGPRHWAVRGHLSQGVRGGAAGGLTAWRGVAWRGVASLALLAPGQGVAPPPPKGRHCSSHRLRPGCLGLAGGQPAHPSEPDQGQGALGLSPRLCRATPAPRPAWETQPGGAEEAALSAPGGRSWGGSHTASLSLPPPRSA